MNQSVFLCLEHSSLAPSLSFYPLYHLFLFIFLYDFAAFLLPHLLICFHPYLIALLGGKKGMGGFDWLTGKALTHTQTPSLHLLFTSYWFIGRQCITQIHLSRNVQCRVAEWVRSMLPVLHGVQTHTDLISWLSQALNTVTLHRSPLLPPTAQHWMWC